MGGDSPVEEFYRDKVSSQISQSKRVVDSPSLGGFHHWGDRLHRESSFGETSQVEFRNLYSYKYLLHQFSHIGLPHVKQEHRCQHGLPLYSIVFVECVCCIYFLMTNRSTAVRTVFLLIRAKRGASPASRLDSLLSSQLFDTVKAQVRYCCFLAVVDGGSERWC